MKPNTLIAAARRLAEILDRENVALEAMDLRQAAALLPEKTAAMDDLEACGKAGSVSADPALVLAARRLDHLVLENRRLLERAIVAQDRVIGIVVEAAASVASNTSYSADGRRPRLNAMTYSARA